MTGIEPSSPPASGHAEAGPGGPAQATMPASGWRARLGSPAGHVPFAAVLLAGVAYRVLAGPAPHSGPVPAAAHAAALLTGAAVYVLLLRWGVWRWLAALATVPVLLDPRMVSGEDHGGPAAYVVLLMAVVLLAAGWRRSGAGALLVGGLVLAAVCTVPAVAGRGAAGSTARALFVPPAADGVGVVVALLVCSAALLGLGRARDSSLRGICALVALPPLVALVAVAAAGTGGTGSRVAGAAALAWWPAAGALGVTALLRGRRGAGAARPQVDAVDRDARDEFDRRYGEPRLAPVVVVIAAFNEGSGLGDVLATLPETVCGLPADVLVVDDGSTDDTAAAVESDARARLVSCRVNRGQGAALRLGYAVARTHGARYLITTDADGQYDTSDLPVVLAPVVEGRADFVSGSRRLGRQHTRDRVRRLGVHVFAWLASALVGQYLTDTSFGLRAMRAGVTGVVTLNQPQYQSSELLVGVLSHGFRVLEVPGTMHVRTAGSSKKGRNLVYGARYARVVLGTWWREGCPSPVAEHAPALRGPVGPTAA
jgi:glycosyl transferase family 2